jgi:sialidase-1
MESLLFTLLVLILCMPTFAVRMDNTPVLAHIDFNGLNTGSFTLIETDQINLYSKNGEDRILGKGGRISSPCLYITGGKDHVVEFELLNLLKSIGHMSFMGQRLSPDLPFSFTIEAYTEDQWVEVYSGDTIIKTEQFSFGEHVSIPDNNVRKMRLRCTSPNNGGLLIDNLILLDKTPMKIKAVDGIHLNLPVLINKEHNPVQKITIQTDGESDPRILKEIRIKSYGSAEIDIIESIKVYYTGSNPEFNTAEVFGEIMKPNQSATIEGAQQLHHGTNYFWISCTISEGIDIRSFIYTQFEDIVISTQRYPVISQSSNAQHRLGLALRDHQDDDVHTFRIPGLVTTNDGTLIAVYDIRRNGSVDLQADIDVGMSRSTNDGQSWEPMQVIMDMHEWGGLPEDENGIGDPSVLVDRSNNTIWVAGVWAHGHKNRRNWLESKPGMDPEMTSQLILVKSEDDGKSWSETINITSAIKKEEWHLLLQGPGKGISMSDGTLVFPAQFKDKDQMPHSTIMWSKDHGLNWDIGTGAKSNTTESQVIELDNGSLMLNMRDNRNREDKSETNGRSVAISDDLGKTWDEYQTSKNALIEPVCMASIIKENFMISGKHTNIILFSNPASKYRRKDMTLKFSFDDGKSWASEYNTLLDEGTGRGYSCMTKIDDQHIGILYESSRADLVFQVINIEEILIQKND